MSLAGSFDASYQGTPPWDIGKPQPAFERLARRGEVRGRVLDAGCGTGEHAILFARLGCDVLGIDGAPRAIALAEAKARARGSAARFRVHDALDLQPLGRFHHILDSGLLHVFDDADRARYVAGLAQALEPGGRYHVLVMRDTGQEFRSGPRRLRREEFAAGFARGWRIVELREDEFATNLADRAFGAAWWATIERA
ncbi:MAG: class I SAM-dependent methyltransferase [Halobacteriales archaeon]|nr:class I SAM-dependent methyltransferase [Halobacteriales archaeon]